MMNKKKDSKDQEQNRFQDSKKLDKKLNNEESILISGASNIKQYFLKSTKKTYSNFFKDLEISRSHFITLELIYLVFIVIIQIILFYIFNINVLLTLNYLIIILVLSILLGLLFGGILIDRMRGKKNPVLLTIMFISLVIIIVYVFFFDVEINFFSALLLIINSFIAGIIFIFFLVAFIEFTTILERGRVLSYLSSVMGIFIFINILFISIILILINSILTFGIAIYFLNKNRKAETPLIYIPVVKKENIKKGVRFSILKYIALLTFFGFIVGLNIPLGNLFFIRNDWDIFFLLILGILLVSITSIFIGSIFDLFGRRTVVSSSILIITMIDFIRIFISPRPLIDLAFSLICAIILFISIPLLISDVCYKSSLGKYLAITYTISFLFLIFGVYLRRNILNFGVDDLTAELMLNAFTGIAAIFILFFLVNTRETLSAKEQNWPENLIHLYIIHTSGLLLYDYSFNDEALGDSDLAAGGLIGLITILQEITQESHRIRIVDHGGKLILFGFNSYKTLVFALVISEELVVLRHKLNKFIEDIDENYPIKSPTISGIDKKLWSKRIDPILYEHFERKYFELIDLKKYKSQNLKP